MIQNSSPFPFLGWFNPRHWLLGMAAILIRLIILLPYPWIIQIGRGLGHCLFVGQKKQRKILQTNILHHFSQMSEQSQKRLIGAFYQSQGIACLETGLAWWGKDSFFKRLNFRWEGSSYLGEALKREKGVIILFCHQMTLELVGRWLSFQIPIGAVYRTEKNPLLNSLMISGRKRTFKNLFLKHQIKSVFKHLKANQIVAMAPDQNLTAAFSRNPSKNMVAIIRLARLSGATIIPITCYRNGGKQAYHLNMLPPLCLSSDSPDDEAKKICDYLKHAILEHPEQYLWLKRKTKSSHPSPLKLPLLHIQPQTDTMPQL